MSGPRLLLSLAVGLAALLPSGEGSGQESSTAPPVESHPDGAVIRIGGDVSTPEGTRHSAIVVFGGDAAVEGSTGLLMVVNGTARIGGRGSAEHVFVADGELQLSRGARVSGDVDLYRATIESAEPGAVAGGVTDRAVDHALRGGWFFGAFLLLGVAAAVIGAGLIATMVARDGVEHVGRIIVQRLPRALGAAALLWLALPMVAVLTLPTVIAIPAGLGVFFFILPFLGFVGFVLAGIALGDAVTGSLRDHRPVSSPYLAAVLGIGLLLMAGMLPILGALVAPLAGAVGSGALLVALYERGLALKRARSER